MAEMKYPTETSPSDTVTINLTGVKPGTGRTIPQVLVQETLPLEPLLQKYASGGESAGVDLVALQTLLQTDPAAFKTAWAQAGAKMSASAGTSLADRVIKAVCAFLEKERDITVSETDPGEVFYVNPADLVPLASKHAHDGWQWFIAMAAPFGA